MKLNCVLSDNLRSSTNKVIDMLITSARESLNVRHILIVPDKFALIAEKKVMQAIKKIAVFNIEVLTLPRLISIVMGNLDKQYLSDSACLMLIRKIILKNKDNLFCFKRAAQNVGFAQTIYETVSQFKKSDIAVDELKNIIENVKIPALKLKLQDIYLIYSEYENELKNNYCDSTAKMNDFIALIENNEMLKSAHIYMAEFDSFITQDYRLIEKFIKHSMSFNIGCHYNFDENKYTVTSTVFAHIKELSKKLSISPNIINFKAPLALPFKHLSNNLYAYPFTKYNLTYGAINLYSSQNINDEITYIARNIRASVISGARYKDFTLLCGAFLSYGDTIEEVFKKFEIPYFLDKTENLQSHALSRFILAALDTVKSNFKFADVMTLVKNYFFSGIQADKFENYCLQYGIDRSRFLQPFTLAKESADYSYAESVRKKFVKVITPLFSLLNNDFTAKDFVSAINEFLKVSNAEETLEKLCETYVKEQNLVQQKISEQVFTKIQSILDEFTQILGEQNVSLDEAYAVFNMGFASSKIAIVPIAIDCVFVGDISVSIPEESDYMFVAGCSGGQVPALKEDTGIINDDEIEHIQKLEPSIKYLNNRQRFKVHQVLCMPYKKIYLTYPLCNEAGEENKPALIINNVSKLFKYKGKDLTISSHDTEMMHSADLNDDEIIAKYVEYFGTETSGLDELSRAMREYKNYQNYASPMAYSALYYAIKNQKQLLSRICANLNYKNDVPNIPDAEKLFFKNEYTKVSQLECYFECPFKHFLDYGLKVQERKESGMRAIDAGNILHKVAELFVKRTKDITENITENDCDNLSYEIISGILKSPDYQGLISDEKNKNAIYSLREEGKRLCRALNYQNQNSLFKPLLTEKYFNGAEINASNIKIKLSGIIDRVDKFGDYMRVIDYKTGKCEMKYNEIYYGLKIQLTVYLYALIKEYGYKVAGAYYLPIHNTYSDDKSTSVYEMYKLIGISAEDVKLLRAMDKRVDFDYSKSDIVPFSIHSNKLSRQAGSYELKKSKFILDDEKIKTLLNYTEKIIAAGVDEIAAGYINCSPSNSDGYLVCDYCKYKGICKFDESAGNTERVLLRQVLGFTNKE